MRFSGSPFPSETARVPGGTELHLLASTESVMHSYNTPMWLWLTLPAILLAYAFQEHWHIRKDHVILSGEALRWTVFYVLCAQAFSLLVFKVLGFQAFGEFQAAFWLEKALSLDNLVVMGFIFESLQVPKAIERRMLDYGIAGAIIMRMAFIFGGLALIHRFEWLTLIFGLLLFKAAYSILKEAVSGEDEVPNMMETRTWRFIDKFLPMSSEFDGHKLFTFENAKRVATPMLAGIILVEFTDVIFAVDSVPAVLSVSPDRFIAYSSNIFAILGLRMFFFFYQDVKERFWALNYGVGVVLAWIGFKLFAAPFGLHVQVALSLGVLGVLLATSVAVSLLVGKPKSSHTPEAEIA